MSDFAQHGPIVTLPCLTPAFSRILDQEILPHLSRATPIALVIPCHSNDAAQPSLHHILVGLSKTSWIQHLIIPINSLSSAHFQTVASAIKSRHPSLPITLLHTDARLPHQAPGKGSNILHAFNFLQSVAFKGVVALQDADTLHFQPENLARLVHPVVDRSFGMEFAKQYYSRFDLSLHGRVSRLFMAPLLESIESAIPNDLARFLSAFRYPLAGECALSMRLAERMHLPSGWGLEIAMLADVHSLVSPEAVCQIGAESPHSHRHHTDTQHLIDQCRAILNTLGSHEAFEGTLTETAWTTIHPTLVRAQLRALRSSSLTAKANGLTHNLEEEMELCSHFASLLLEPRTRIAFDRCDFSESTL